MGSGFPDGVSDDRSSLKATFFSSLLCFPFGCPFKRVVRPLRCVQDRGADFFPPIVPERGCVEQVRKFMQGDHYIGRGSRERNFSSRLKDPAADFLKVLLPRCGC